MNLPDYPCPNCGESRVKATNFRKGEVGMLTFYECYRCGNERPSQKKVGAPTGAGSAR
jgi:predicted RNA-binding Zn-ribbon protein involved in translation (DUF1610 family)